LHKLSSPSNPNASKPEIFSFVEKILFFNERTDMVRQAVPQIARGLKSFKNPCRIGPIIAREIVRGE
jgi:hypothetical protein